MIYCFNLDFYVFFVCGISRKTVISFSYVFLCFTAWLVNIITQAQQSSTCWRQASHMERHGFFYQHYQPGTIISQFLTR